MTINFELKMKGISKFDIYSNDRLDIKKIGDYFGRETGEINFINDDTVSFSSGSVYFDDIFKSLTLKYPNSVLRVKCVSDEDFSNSPYAFYKNGKYFASFVTSYNFLRVPKRFKHKSYGELIDDKGNYYYDQAAMDFLVNFQDEVDDNDNIFYNTFGHEAVLSKDKCKFNEIKNCDILDIKSEADADKLATFDMHLVTKEISKDDFLLLFDDSNKWLLNDLKESIEDNKNKEIKAYSFVTSDDYSDIDYDECRKHS